MKKPFLRFVAADHSVWTRISRGESKHIRCDLDGEGGGGDLNPALL